MSSLFALLAIPSAVLAQQPLDGSIQRPSTVGSTGWEAAGQFGRHAFQRRRRRRGVAGF